MSGSPLGVEVILENDGRRNRIELAPLTYASEVAALLTHDRLRFERRETFVPQLNRYSEYLLRDLRELLGTLCLFTS